ncbi:TonB-dependent receptor domain-containing protein [Sphingomonas faeni]|uniref:TonB-dependent receptor domain-containing protein n=1 Tax=Sphingomonas faeni TaxID=185950 RepID=UPI00277E700A|nr:TonB-dependent receptor [Sphingomonas faeni]MDQ0838653.1 iron complex outermembrane receptor protein [Sphingomonas faeni]
MVTTSRFTSKALLLAAATPFALVLSTTTGFAQDATTATDAQTVAPTAQTLPADESSEGQDIVVTGSLFRGADTGPSPVTTLTAATLQQRGINTAAEAVQRLTANGAGTISQGWNTGSNFATGATAASLRGLSVQSTLTLFDGLRMAPYPLADDGQRNFVDMNTIPSSLVDRIEVLKDGASSTYGADAVAGVINVIMKKQIEGLHLNGSAGISDRGDGAEQRLDATWGYGDLATQGFNFYVNGEYQNTEAVNASDRGYPFNSSDLSRICNDAGSCIAQPAGARNFFNADGTYSGLASTTVAMVRPVDETGGALGRYNILNAADGCRDLNPVTVLPGQSPTAGSVVCQQDFRKQYLQVLPQQERYGFSGRFTANVGDNAQAYVSGNYYRTNTFTQISPLGFNNQTTPPGSVLLNPLYLPAYVCAGGVGSLTMLDTGCNAGNGVLNPNNPFAASGSRAQLLSLYDRPRTIETNSRALRLAAGISGTFGDDWKYSGDFTASNTQLDVIQKNYLIPQRLLDVIARGTYDFVNPGNNSEEIRNYISPENRTRSTADLWQIQGTLSKSLFTLPGGPLQVAIGGAYRKESIDNPSANPQNDAHPYDRYYGVNSVGAVGSRNVKSAFFEINAPVLDQLVINGSGRYDDYSSGQSNFSPIQQFSVRGTFSKGFRIPSFNEANGLPTTGYVTRSLDPSIPAQAAFIAAHGGNSYATGQFSLGNTSTGNPDLDPEKSTSWTLGAIFEPTSRINFTVDYFNIKVKGIINPASSAGAFEQYYANNGVVNLPGVVVRPGLADNDNPAALPQIGFIEVSYQNADEQRVSGIDFGANARFPIGDNVTFITSADASYLLKFEKQTADGNVERYDGTLSPCNNTSCSGSPKWRATWQNTLEVGAASLSATAYYTAGYDLASTDVSNGYSGVKGDCEASIGSSVVTYQDGSPVLCNAKATWNLDMTATVKVNDRFTLYTNVLNILDIKPPFDPSGGYSINQYNPAWTTGNIMGRFIRVGARVGF